MKLKLSVFTKLIALAAVFCSVSYAQTFSVIHTFTGAGDGEFPSAGVTLRAGILYGTASKGGDAEHPNGAVYQISRLGSLWATTTLYLFQDPHGEYNPLARVMFSPDGHLYSTTHLGTGNGEGSVFQLTPLLTICKTSNCFWTKKVLHVFTSSPDGSQPDTADIAFDPQGNIYGTTRYGGSVLGGMVYQMQRSGDSWKENTLYNFGTPVGDGYNPAGGVIRDKNGNLFGTTVGGGAHDFGTVWELTNTPGVGWTETILYSFQNAGDGKSPWAGLVMDQSGNLYGATNDGGSAGGGTIFELSPSGNSWTFNVLYSLAGQAGGGVEAALSIDAAGNLYGTAVWNGAHRPYGSVFKLTNTGNGWTYTSLHDFTGGEDGANPMSSVAIDTDGTLYGTAYAGGSRQGICSVMGCGTVWMIKQ
jgi:uncharacterized repeat protein (TIGR03803 family)